MPDHAIFGSCLRAEIPFPELRSAEGRDPAWQLRMSAVTTPLCRPEYLGEDLAVPGVTVRLYRHATGFRLCYDDTGLFDISADGATITWCPAPQARVELARLDVMGRVLATALHASGMLCLHGSAVALPAGAVAFLAPKFHGKSTLALALVAAGARLITDDTLPVDPRSPITAWPGVHSVRLFGDSAGRLAGAARQGDNPFAEKHTLTDLPEHRLMTEPAPLAAIYELSPVSPRETRRPAHRTPLRAVPAAVAVLRHTTLGTLLGKSESAVVFDRAVAVGRAVPIYRLEVVRDFDRLDDVVAQLMEWHGARPKQPTGRAHSARAVERKQTAGLGGVSLRPTGAVLPPGKGPGNTTQ